MLDLGERRLAAPVPTDTSATKRSQRFRALLPSSGWARWHPVQALVTPLVCEAAEDERLLAWVRLGASSALLIRLLTDTGPGHSPTVRFLTAAYIGYAALVLLASRWRSEWLLGRVTAVHVIDFAWTTVATVVGGGTGSHAFAYFAFVLAAAAFRWDLKRTLANGALVLAIGLVESAAAAAGITPWAFEFDEFLLRVSFIACGMAVLFGILADRLHRTRYQAAAIAALVSTISRASRLREAVADTLVSIANVLNAGRVVLVSQDAHTGATTVWQAVRQADRVVTSQSMLPHGRAEAWTLVSGRGQWPCELRRKGSGGDPAVRQWLRPSEGNPATWLPLPAGLVSASSWRTLLAVPFSASGAWSGQLYVMDPRGPGGEIRLRFLGDIAQQIMPGLLNLYLLRRLRTRAESLERSRIARELHDTANQSIAAIDMRLAVLRRRASQAAPPVADELLDIQELVHGLMLDLREFVARRPEHLDAGRLPGALADLVDRLTRESEIDAKLEWAVTRLDLPPHHCSEVARIVQEALFNVRRHSGATRVLVRVEADAGGWAVIVEDNGRGLGFTGRLVGDDPELERRAPRVIRERVRMLGGTVAIASSCAGTRLEIAFPAPELC